MWDSSKDFLYILRTIGLRKEISTQHSYLFLKAREVVSEPESRKCITNAKLRKSNFGSPQQTTGPNRYFRLQVDQKGTSLNRLLPPKTKLLLEAMFFIIISTYLKQIYRSKMAKEYMAAQFHPLQTWDQPAEAPWPFWTCISTSGK